MKESLFYMGSVVFGAMTAIIVVRSCKSSVRIPSKPSTGEHAFRPSVEERRAIAIAKRE